MKGLWSNSLTCGYDEKIILENINIKIPEEKYQLLLGQMVVGNQHSLKPCLDL
ncbi:ferric enterobactin transport ATP-binding protein FepC [Streptococcus pneumoniae BHN191]|nr:ferric enterobactin transport ATP-binding protein FepC [Streptococcus pneumoniae BHN191]